MFGIYDLQEINKLLVAIAELAGRTGLAESSRVAYLCQTIVLAGRKHNHKRLVALSAALGLLARSGANLALTPLGKRYLALNPDQIYELTAAQKRFLLESLIFDGKFRLESALVFRLFKRDYGRDTWILDTIDRPIPQTIAWLPSLFIGLGAVHREQQLLLVAPEYRAQVTRLVTEKKGLSPEELAKILGARRGTGEMGEVLVERFERERLLLLGRKAEADLVRRISLIDTAAGYDIQSFDGDQPAYDYDRFIEVKASADMKIRFNWTRNEVETARILGDNYWIYFCSEVDTRNPQRLHLVLIQNPVVKLPRCNFSMEPSEYLVEHSGPLPPGTQLQMNEPFEASIL